MGYPIVDLRQFIVDHYNLNELRTLCIRLHVGCDDLPGEDKSAKVHRLVSTLERQQRLDKLLLDLQKTHSAPDELTRLDQIERKVLTWPGLCSRVLDWVKPSANPSSQRWR